MQVDTYLLLGQTHRVIEVCSSGCHIRVVEIRELGISQAHGFIEIVSLNRFRNCLCIENGVHERFSGDFVLIDGNKRGFGFGRCIEDLEIINVSIERSNLNIEYDNSMSQTVPASEYKV